MEAEEGHGICSRLLFVSGCFFNAFALLLYQKEWNGNQFFRPICVSSQTHGKCIPASNIFIKRILESRTETVWGGMHLTFWAKCSYRLWCDKETALCVLDIGKLRLIFFFLWKMDTDFFFQNYFFQTDRKKAGQNLKCSIRKCELYRLTVAEFKF